MDARHLVALLMLTLAGPLAAQQRGPIFARWEAFAAVPAKDTANPRLGDYRYEGLLFGGLVFGALGAWMGSRDFGGICPLGATSGCGDNGSHVGRAIAVGLVGAAAGGGLGYLVGRFSPKKPRPDSLPPLRELTSIPDSIRIRVSYQHWRGAGIGLAVGAAVGAITGAVLSTIECSDCQQPSMGEAALIVGLLGAGTGGVVGFLAGLSSPKYVWVPRSASAD